MGTHRQPPGRPFEKGNPGRRKGSKNKATVEAREIAQRIMEDPDYLDELAKRIRAGTAPHMETLMAHYAWGKPKDRVEHSNPDGSALFGGLRIEVVRSDTNGNGHAGH